MFGLPSALFPPLSIGQPYFSEHLQVSRSVAVNPSGTTLHYTDVVDPKIPSRGSAVLLPGLYGTEVSEEVVAGIFAELGYRVRMPMLRGYGILPGRSVKGAGSRFGYGKDGMIVEDLPFLINKANEDFSQPVTLLGFSAGALVAANYLSGAIADSSAGQVGLARDAEAAKERAERVTQFIDFAGPHGAPPLFLPHKIMLQAMAPFLSGMPAYDLRSNAFVQHARDYLLPFHLAMTPWPVRVTPMLLHPMAMSLSVYMNPANLTYEEFTRLMYAGFGRAEHDHMVEQKQHLLGKGFAADNGYDFLAAAKSIRVPTFYINGAHDRMSPPDQANHVMRTMAAKFAKGSAVIPGCGHLDSTFGKNAYRPLRAALAAIL